MEFNSSQFLNESLAYQDPYSNIIELIYSFHLLTSTQSIFPLYGIGGFILITGHTNNATQL